MQLMSAVAGSRLSVTVRTETHLNQRTLYTVYTESTVGAQKQVSSADPGAMRNGLSRDTR